MLYKSFSVTNFKALDEQQGIFEALVAVFNNIDRVGDRILPGAFKASLETWGEKGRPIPVIFAHEWDNLDAHIGEVLEAKEVDEGLYIKAQLEMDEEFAQRVYKKMVKGTLAEFSFAYDVVDSVLVDQGDEADRRYITDLKVMDLLEVGPCLVGMNPATELIAVKDALAALKAGAPDGDTIQQIHDLTVSLGAKCVEPDDSGEGDDEGKTGDIAGKSSGPTPKSLAARIAAELIETGTALI